MGVVPPTAPPTHPPWTPPPITPPSRLRKTLGIPTVVRMPVCHSRRFKGERPIGAATGQQSQPPRPCAKPPPRAPSEGCCPGGAAAWGPCPQLWAAFQRWAAFTATASPRSATAQNSGSLRCTGGATVPWWRTPVRGHRAPGARGSPAGVEPKALLRGARRNDPWVVHRPETEGRKPQKLPSHLLYEGFARPWAPLEAFCSAMHVWWTPGLWQAFVRWLFSSLFLSVTSPQMQWSAAPRGGTRAGHGLQPPLQARAHAWPTAGQGLFITGPSIHPESWGAPRALCAR